MSAYLVRREYVVEPLPQKEGIENHCGSQVRGQAILTDTWHRMGIWLLLQSTFHHVPSQGTLQIHQSHNFAHLTLIARQHGYKHHQRQTRIKKTCPNTENSNIHLILYLKPYLLVQCAHWMSSKKPQKLKEDYFTALDEMSNSSELEHLFWNLKDEKSSVDGQSRLQRLRYPSFPKEIQRWKTKHKGNASTPHAMKIFPEEYTLEIIQW